MNGYLLYPDDEFYFGSDSPYIFDDLDEAYEFGEECYPRGYRIEPCDDGGLNGQKKR